MPYIDAFPLAAAWQTGAVALGCGLAVSLLLVLTQRHHGHLTMDSMIGVQKFHDQPTPRIGGAAIYAAVLAAWFWIPSAAVRDVLRVLLLAGLPALLVGFAEDLTKRVGVRARLLATMASGVAAWLMTDVALRRLEVPLLDLLLLWTPAAIVFTSFAVAGIANAVNIIDGFHGLASGTTIIALGTLGLIAQLAGDPVLALACVLVAAAVGGFWLVNYPWGRLFLGDGGAYFAGFALGWLAVLLPVRNPEISAWASLLACAYPVIEVLYSIWRRFRSRRSPGAPDSEHLHSLIKVRVIRPGLPWASRGVRNAAVAPFLWVFALVPATLAVLLRDDAGWLALGFLGPLPWGVPLGGRAGLGGAGRIHLRRRRAGAAAGSARVARPRSRLTAR